MINSKSFVKTVRNSLVMNSIPNNDTDLPFSQLIDKQEVYLRTYD